MDLEKHWAVTRWTGAYDYPDREIFRGNRIKAVDTYKKVASRLRRGRAMLIDHKGDVLRVATPPKDEETTE